MKNNLPKKYIDNLIKYWYIPIVFCLISFVTVYTLDKFYFEKEYESNTEILLLPKNTKDISSNESNIRLNIQLMNTYMNIVSSDQVLRSVKKDLKLRESVFSLKSKISLNSDDNSLSMKIVIKDSSASRSKMLAKSISQVAIKKINVYFPNNKIVILNPATEGKLISVRKLYYLYSVIGLWLGMFMVFILTIKNKK